MAVPETGALVQAGVGSHCFRVTAFVEGGVRQQQWLQCRTLRVSGEPAGLCTQGCLIRHPATSRETQKPRGGRKWRALRPVDPSGLQQAMARASSWACSSQGRPGESPLWCKGSSGSSSGCSRPTPFSTGCPFPGPEWEARSPSCGQKRLEHLPCCLSRKTRSPHPPPVAGREISDCPVGFSRILSPKGCRVSGPYCVCRAGAGFPAAL